MSKNWKMFLFVGALIVVAGLGVIFALGNNRQKNTLSQNGSGEVAGAVSSQDNYIERLARHLSDSSMVLYGSSLSSETKDQKALFGEAITAIDYVDCDVAGNSSNPDECVGQDITIYPTWVYNGEKFEGEQSLSDLAKITNFEQ
jgi:hypothetical protein